MFVELKGIPGSGKSFFCNALCDSKEILSANELYRAKKSSYRKMINLKILFKFGIDILKILYLYLSADAPFKFKKSSLVCFFQNLKKMYVVLNNMDYDKIYIIDEGITHPTTILNQKTEKYYKIILNNKWMKNIYSKTTFVFLYTDIEKCNTRIFSRSQNIPFLYSNIDKEHLKQELQKDENHVKHEENILSKNQKCISIKNFNDKDIKQIRDELLNDKK